MNKTLTIVLTEDDRYQWVFGGFEEDEAGLNTAVMMLRVALADIERELVKAQLVREMASAEQKETASDDSGSTNGGGPSPEGGDGQEGDTEHAETGTEPNGG